MTSHPDPATDRDFNDLRIAYALLAEREEKLRKFVERVSWTQPEAYTTYIDPDFIDMFKAASDLLASLPAIPAAADEGGEG